MLVKLGLHYEKIYKSYKTRFILLCFLTYNAILLYYETLYFFFYTNEFHEVRMQNFIKDLPGSYVTFIYGLNKLQLIEFAQQAKLMIYKLECLGWSTQCQNRTTLWLNHCDILDLLKKVSIQQVLVIDIYTMCIFIISL